MRNNHDKQAVAYLRVSGLSQVDGDGFARQREAIQNRAQASGLVVVEEFVDAGVSGATGLYERPGLTVLFAKLSSNRISTVLVERADRLARDLIEGELILRELRQAGIRVIEAEGGTDLMASDRNPTSKLIRQVLGAVSEFEKSALVAKLRAARGRKKMESGRCEGPAPFGSLPEEEAVLADLLRLARKRNGKRPSCAAIAREMDRLGNKPRHGQRWSRSSVRQVLLRHGKQG